MTVSLAVYYILFYGEEISLLLTPVSSVPTHTDLDMSMAQNRPRGRQQDNLSLSTSEGIEVE